MGFEINFVYASEFAKVINYRIGNDTVGEFVLAFAIFLLAYTVLELFRAIILKRIKNLTGRTSSELDDVLVEALSKVGKIFYFLTALYIALRVSTINVTLQKLTAYALLVVATFYFVRSLQKIFAYFAKKEIEKRGKGEQESQKASVAKLVTSAINIALWVLAALFVLSNFGFDITSLIAGLGIGGLAIALALQNVFSDVFATLSIYFDKPFKVGDFIIIGQDMGTVQYIGLKSTRIKTLQGQELIISNKEITSIRVNNYKRMEKRRIAFSLGVVYETPTEKMKKIPEIIRQIMAKVETTELDRVHFKEFGKFSLNLEIVYYVLSPDYNLYMDVQQKINIAIKEAFEKEKISFAFPTQTILLEDVNKL